MFGLKTLSHNVLRFSIQELAYHTLSLPFSVSQMVYLARKPSAFQVVSARLCSVRSDLSVRPNGLLSARRQNRGNPQHGQRGISPLHASAHAGSFTAFLNSRQFLLLAGVAPSPCRSDRRSAAGTREEHRLHPRAEFSLQTAHCRARGDQRAHNRHRTQTLSVGEENLLNSIHALACSGRNNLDAISEKIQSERSAGRRHGAGQDADDAVLDCHVDRGR